MARNKKSADAAAKNYFHTKRRIKELKAKREELWQRNKTEKSAEIFSGTFKLSSKIEAAIQELNVHAQLVVEYLYGEEEEQDEQQA